MRVKPMTKSRYLFACAAGCCLLLFVSGALAQTLQIIDVDGHASTVTAAQIANSPHVTVDVSEHDKAAQFRGVPLAALLSAAGIQLGDAMRGPRMSEVLLVEAGDGYRVAFALAEIDPAFATREIILADMRDGKPLDARKVR